MSERVLVVGGSGQIGKYVVYEQLKRGNEVVVLDPVPPLSFEEKILKRIVYLPGTGNSLEMLKKSGRIDKVVYVGGMLGTGLLSYRIEEAMENNVRAFASVLSYASQNNADVVVGLMSSIFSDRLDGYALTHRAKFEICVDRTFRDLVNCKVALLPHVYDVEFKPLLVRKALASFVVDAIVHGRIRVVKDYVIDLLFAGDAARGLIYVLDRGLSASSEYYYIAKRGNDVKLGDVARLVSNMTGANVEYLDGGGTAIVMDAREKWFEFTGGVFEKEFMRWNELVSRYVSSALSRVDLVRKTRYLWRWYDL